METYPRRFVEAAFCYLAIGVVFGLYMAVFPIGRAVLFGHVHLLLLGFMSMAVFGIGYHILPRFNNRPVRWPGLIPVHFALAQLGLIGMIMTSPGTGLPSVLFSSAGLIEVVSVMLFVVNIQSVFFGGQAGEKAKAVPRPSIGVDSVVGRVLERWPQAREYFVAQGFAGLGNPSHGGPGGPRISIAQACMRHGKDPQAFLAGLVGFLGLQGAGATVVCRPDDKIGDLVARFPATREVFLRHYGEGCFSCAGQAYETVAETAAMHGIELERILAELNEVLRRN